MLTRIKDTIGSLQSKLIYLDQKFKMAATIVQYIDLMNKLFKSIFSEIVETFKSKLNWNIS